MVASTEELVQWLQGPQYDVALAALPRPLTSPQAGIVACSSTVTHLVTLQPFVRHMLMHDPCVFVFSCTGRLWPCLGATWVSNVP